MKTRCTDSCSSYQPMEGSMYQVFRNKRVVLKGEMFSSYEQARQALRRRIRNQVRKGKYDKDMFHGNTAWDYLSRQPVNFTDAGFTIRKVA